MRYLLAVVEGVAQGLGIRKPPSIAAVRRTAAAAAAFAFSYGVSYSLEHVSSWNLPEYLAPLAGAVLLGLDKRRRERAAEGGGGEA